MKLFIPTIVFAASVIANGQSLPTYMIAAPNSATKARDIGGFELGTPISEIARTVSVEALGGDGFQVVRGGITYDFGATPRGRVYRIQSSQPLGHFAVDEAFLAALARKLSTKYGPPTNTTNTTFGWELVEPVKRAGSTVLPFRTMWASAYVVSAPDGVSVNMTMIDFRLLWQDEIAINREPRSKAAADIAF